MTERIYPSMKSTKKITAPLAALLLTALLMGCAGESALTTGSVAAPTASTTAETVKPTSTDGSAEPTKPLGDRTLGKLIEEIYANVSGVEFPTLVSRDVSLTDKESFKWVFGIEPPAQAVAAAASEPMIGSIPYTVALLQLEDGADPAAVAAAVKAGVDPRKWVCTSATTMETAHHGNVVFLIMDNDANRANALLKAFDAVMR